MWKRTWKNKIKYLLKEKMKSNCVKKVLKGGSIEQKKDVDNVVKCIELV